MNLKHVRIWTDGACSGNPGPGGWGVLMRFKGAERETSREICGGEAQTTNNRMELTAAVKALETLKEPCSVDLHTDSKYVMEGMTKWLEGWKKRDWKTAGKKSVKNAELWRQLDEAAKRHRVNWHWVKGHDGNPENERADELAREGLKSADKV